MSGCRRNREPLSTLKREQRTSNQEQIMKAIYDLYLETERKKILQLVESKLLNAKDDQSERCDAVFHEAILKCEDTTQSVILASMARQWAILAFAWKPAEKSYEETINMLLMFLSAGVQEAIESHREEEAAG